MASLMVVVLAVLVLRTDRQTELHTDAAHRLTHATVVGESKYCSV